MEATITDTAQEFIAALCASSLVTFQCFHDRGDRDKHPPFILHGTLDEHRARLEAANADGYGIFITVNQTDGKGRRAKNIVALRALFIDSDDGPIKTPWHITPNIVVSSKNGEHAYWLLSDGEPLEKFSAAQHALATRYGTDPSIKDLPRVMRLPGFYHCKSNPYMVTFYQNTDEKHTIDEIIGAAPTTAKQITASYPIVAQHAAKRFEAYLIKAGVAIEGERNSKAHLLAKRGGDFGLDEYETMSILSAWNQRNPKPLDEKELVATVTAAYRYRKNDIGSDAGSSRKAPALVVAATKARIAAADLRHAAEHIEAFPDDSAEIEAYTKDLNKIPELKAAKKELAQSRIEEARVEIAARSEYGVPNGYIIGENGITLLTATDEGVKEIVVTPTPIIITRRFVLEESGEEYLELSWEGKKRTFLKSVLFDARSIVKLSAYGPSVTSINSRLVVQYLQAFDDANKKTLPIVHVVEKFGDHGALGWQLGNETINKGVATVEYWADRASPGVAPTSIGVSGTWETQREILRGLEKHPKALLCFYASCASPLLSHFRIPGFVVDINGKTSQGKTTAMRIASSVWGKPSALMQKWNTTETYRERWAAFHNHVPIFLDDHKDRGAGLRHVIDGEHPITAAIYQLADGIGRGRGTITGLQALRRWQLVAFSTGESSLLDYDSSEGSLVRCLSIDGKITDGASNEWMHQLTKLEQHHGHIGKAIVEKLKTFTDDLSETIDHYARDLIAGGMGAAVADRIAQRFAIIMISAEIVHKVIDLPWTFDPMALDETLYSTVGAVKNADRTDDAVRALYDYALSRRSQFYGHADHAATRDTLGVWFDHNDLCGTVYFLSTAFDAACKSLGYSAPTIKRDFKARGWLDVSDDRYTTRIMIDGVRGRAIGVRFGTAGAMRDLTVV